MNSAYIKKLRDDVNIRLDEEVSYHKNISEVIDAIGNPEEIPQELIKKAEKSIRTMELLSDTIISLNEILLL